MQLAACFKQVLDRVGTQIQLKFHAPNKEVLNFYLAYYLTLKVLVATINALWEGMGDVGSARYEPALLPPCPTIRVLSYSS